MFQTLCEFTKLPRLKTENFEICTFKTEYLGNAPGSKCDYGLEARLGEGRVIMELTFRHKDLVGIETQISLTRDSPSGIPKSVLADLLHQIGRDVKPCITEARANEQMGIYLNALPLMIAECRKIPRTRCQPTRLSSSYALDEALLAQLAIAI